MGDIKNKVLNLNSKSADFVNAILDKGEASLDGLEVLIIKSDGYYIPKYINVGNVLIFDAVELFDVVEDVIKERISSKKLSKKMVENYVSFFVKTEFSKYALMKLYSLLIDFGDSRFTAFIYSKINKDHGAVYCVCFSDMCKYEKGLAFYQLPYLVKKNDYSGCLNYLGKSSLEIDIVCYLLEHGLISDFKKLISWVNKVYKDKKFDKKFERAFLIFVLCFLEFEEPIGGKFYDDNIEDIVFNKMLPENGAAILEVFLLVSDDGNYKSKYAAQVRTLIEDIEDDKKVIQILCGSLGAAVD
ncbi:MAG: hypothetical protein IJZ30_04085 [Alphaproteobacteria bacterium]|nr:hypothetical protein [Alphaproteobacteria bacterium]